jgi:hypothetical protein
MNDDVDEEVFANFGGADRQHVWNIDHELRFLLRTRRYA